MKESRANAFSHGRNIPIERKVLIFSTWVFPPKVLYLNKNKLVIPQLINDIVRKELAHEIDNDIELHEIILKEIFESWESWQNEEYERSMETAMEFEEQSRVFCPVCQRNILNLQENIISCGCGLRWAKKTCGLANLLCCHSFQTLLSQNFDRLLW